MATGLFNLKQVNQAISQGAWSGYIAPKWVEYLVVAGGGGGYVGGGGGGGLLTGIVTVATGTSYTVTVGAGGAITVNGSNSVFGSISATGGGTYAANGGSGGGGNHSGSITGGQGVSGQGNAGGNNTSGTTYGAGGGGAGTKGLDTNSGGGGNGGAGIASAITGTVVTYAGGGGGSGSGTQGIGGVGGGGTAYSNATGNPNSGGGNTGGGAGGSYAVGGGSGGSGIVVVRYPGSVQFFTGGTLSYANGYMIHTFYSSGTLAPTTPTPYVTDYQISRSLRFNSADSAYLNRTPASAGNRRTWTLSFWIKKTANGASYTNIFGAADSASNRTDILWHPSDYLRYYDYPNAYSWFAASSPGGTWNLYRDVSAWYHIVIAVDTTQAINADRVKGYINGSFVAGSTDTYTQNAQTAINSTIAHTLGAHNIYGQYMNAYLAEVNFIDGQQLTASSFGYTNPNTGVWSPLAFVGTYGTNGFYLNFSDNSNTTAATLGKDYSGNGNNWTPNNFSVTAGAGNDSLVDSPTSYGTDTGVGGEVRGNYCTWNAVLQTNDAANTYANGNLEVSSSGSNWANGTISTNTGSYYFELTPSAGASGLYLGINNTKTDVRITAYSGGIEATAGGGSNQGSLASWSNGDIIGVAVNGVSKTVQFYRNGSTYGTLVTYTTALDLFPFARNGSISSSTVIMNSGQRAFAYTAPSGYKALCTQNLPTPTIGATSTTLATKYFNPVLYTGNATTNAITGVGFQPDFVWMKNRASAFYHGLYDAVRGTGTSKSLYSNTTEAEGTNSANQNLVSFDADGFTLGATSSTNAINTSAQSHVAWNWKANGSGSTNTAGSITSTVSANTTSGFSVATFTTTTGSSQTWGHGLGVAPAMVITRWRDAVDDWYVYHKDLGATKYIKLNSTAAAITSSTLWNDTAPSSTVVTFGSGLASVHTMVAYCFAEVAGYSKFGSYTGNGSTDGPFVYCGFRPAFVMFKKSDSGSESWVIVDTTRNTSNVMNNLLLPNTSGAEVTATYIDAVSNGFKIRETYSSQNASGGTYIYMAFASNPFKYSLAR